MFVIFLMVFAFLLVIGVTAMFMAIRDADSWFHRRFNPQKKYADEGLSTEMADMENIQPGEDGFPKI